MYLKCIKEKTKDESSLYNYYIYIILYNKNKIWRTLRNKIDFSLVWDCTIPLHMMITRRTKTRILYLSTSSTGLSPSHWKQLNWKSIFFLKEDNRSSISLKHKTNLSSQCNRNKFSWSLVEFISDSFTLIETSDIISSISCLILVKQWKIIKQLFVSDNGRLRSYHGKLDLKGSESDQTGVVWKKTYSKLPKSF